jgi:DNA repair exonuclease SbcCD nuclease subunit
VKKYLFDPMCEIGMPMHIILGNHDVYYKESNAINSPDLIFNDYRNVEVFPNPVECNEFVYLPWINKENAQESYNLLKATKSRVVLGHLELAGFRMNKNQMCEHGMGAKIFEKFDLVCSGHFHSKNSKGHIHYLGSPYQMTWIDAGEDKGFHVLDTKTLELEFIKNPHNLYETIVLDENNLPDPSKYKNKIVRIYTNDIESKSDFDNFEKELEKNGAYEVRIIESKNQLGSTLEMSDQIEIEDTSKIIRDYIANSQDIENKEILIALMQELYDEALSLR